MLIFWKIWRALASWKFFLIRVCITGVTNARFSENLACFVFLKDPFWDFPFCFITVEFNPFCLIFQDWIPFRTPTHPLELATQYNFKQRKIWARLPYSHYLKDNVSGKLGKIFKLFISHNQHFSICNSSEILPGKNRISTYSQISRSFKTLNFN